MHMSRYLFILLFLFSNQINAIVNVEDMRVAEPSDGFSGKFDFGMAGASGNTEKSNASLGTRLQWHQGKATDFIVLNYTYGESSGVRNTNKGFLHARHVSQSWAKTAWEGFAQAEKNEFTRLSYRGLLGAGLRFSLNNENRQSALHLGLGGFYSIEELEAKTGLTDDGVEKLWRANLYISYKHNLDNGVQLMSTTYYQPEIGNAADFRLSEQAALSVSLSKRMRLVLSLDVSHDSEPPQSVEKTDTSYNTRFEVQF